MKPLINAALALAFSCAGLWQAQAQAIVAQKDISAQAALKIAQAAIEACRKNNFDISVVVVDRVGQIKVAVRADTASPHNFDLARRKAYTARTFKRTSASWAKRMVDEPDLSGQKNLAEVIPLGGGVPIMLGDDAIGGVGVSGTPAQDKDEACATAGVDAIKSDLK